LTGDTRRLALYWKASIPSERRFLFVDDGGGMSDQIEKFRKEREALNEVILNRDNVNIKRFFGIDSAVYRDGTLDTKTKELLGLAASTVLRCDDCITYHLIRCAEEGVADGEFDDTMAVALIIGGSITIPHLRRAYRLWTELHADK
jgi:AhpD family alkylhydroperoxidase